MFIINPKVSPIAVGVVVVFHGVLMRRQLDAPFGDVRSGLFVALAQWAAQKAFNLRSTQERAWKPSLLVPVDNPTELRCNYSFLRDLARPTCYIELLGIGGRENQKRFEAQIHDACQDFQREDIFARGAILKTNNYESRVIYGMEALSATLFRPNIVVLPLPKTEEERAQIDRIVETATDNEIGKAVLRRAPKSDLNVLGLADNPDWQQMNELVEQSQTTCLFVRDSGRESALASLTVVPSRIEPAVLSVAFFKAVPTGLPHEDGGKEYAFEI